MRELRKGRIVNRRTFIDFDDSCLCSSVWHHLNCGGWRIEERVWAVQSAQCTKRQEESGGTYPTSNQDTQQESLPA